MRNAEVDVHLKKQTRLCVILDIVCLAFLYVHVYEASDYLGKTESSLISSNFLTFLRQTHSSSDTALIAGVTGINFSTVQTSDMLKWTSGEKDKM